MINEVPQLNEDSSRKVSTSSFSMLCMTTFFIFSKKVSSSRSILLVYSWLVLSFYVSDLFLYFEFIWIRIFHVYMYMQTTFCIVRLWWRCPWCAFYVFCKLLLETLPFTHHVMLYSEIYPVETCRSMVPGGCAPLKLWCVHVQNTVEFSCILLKKNSLVFLPLYVNTKEITNA